MRFFILHYICSTAYSYFGFEGFTQLKLLKYNTLLKPVASNLLGLRHLTLNCVIRIRLLEFLKLQEIVIFFSLCVCDMKLLLPGNQFCANTLACVFVNLQESEYVCLCLRERATERGRGKKELESERTDALVTNTLSGRLATPSACSC